MQEDDAALQSMVQEGVPQGHPMHSHVERSLRMVQDNPTWKFEQKERYIKNVIRSSQQMSM